MTDYFQYFVNREFPEGATREQRELLNKEIGNLEDFINTVIPQALDCPEQLQNNLYIAVYEVMRYRKMH